MENNTVFILSLLTLCGCRRLKDKPEAGDLGIDMGRIDEDASTDAEMQPLDASGDAAVLT